MEIIKKLNGKVPQISKFSAFVAIWLVIGVGGSIENAGYPNGLPDWGTYLGTLKKQIFQDY